MSKAICLTFALFTLVLQHGISGDPAQVPDIDCEANGSMPSLPFEDCGSELDVLNVTISSCDEAPCSIPIQSTVIVDVKLQKDSRLLKIDLKTQKKHKAFWVLNGIQTPGEIISSGTFTCDKKPILRAMLRIGEKVTNVPGSLHWSVYDKDEKVAVCFIVPVIVEKKSLPSQRPKDLDNDVTEEIE